jgi:hypothetical protein
MSFPSNPNDNDIVERFGRRFRYKSSKGAWDSISSPIVAPTVEAAPTTSSVAQAVNLPMSGNAVGSMAYSQDTNTLYVWNGTGWFKIALVNTNPTITTGGDATYALAEDGTPTVITLVANDPEGIPLTWSYSVTSGSLEDVTISNTGAVFTITPGAIETSFNLTFTASDGINIDTSVSSFTLVFVPVWTAATLLHTLDNPNSYGTAADDNFGYSVAISGDYAIVGAPYEDDGASFSGIAYIFNVVTGSLIYTLRNPESNKSSNFYGWSVAMSGNYAIVGAVYTDNSSGKAYIYNVTTGALVHTLTNPNAFNTPGNDQFGNSVAMSGNYAIVGAPFEDDPSRNDSGKAYIFNVTTGALLFTLNNPNAFGTSDGDNFGHSVAVSGNYAIVGAIGEDDAALGGGNGSNSGKAYIFDVTTGALVHTLDNPNAHHTTASDQFGKSIAISGNYAAVGAPNEDNNGGNDSGVVYVFNVTTGALVHTLVNRNLVGTAQGDTFGTSISMDSYVIFVGAPAENVGGSGGGGIYMYDVTTGALILPSIFYNNGAVTQDQLGTSVSVSGSYAIAGAVYQYSNGGNGGACKIFKAG